MTASHLRVSLVIPAYNEEDHLRACLDAVARQTVKPFEVIVVDNNSTDATAAIARSYPFVTVVAESRQGKVYARNAGFNAAHGDVIGRIDADTRLPVDWVARLVQSFSAHPSVAAITGRGYFYDMPLYRALSVLHTAYYYHTQRFITGICALWGANMAIRRSAWLQVRGQCNRLDDAFFDEDIDLALCLHKAGQRVLYVKGLPAAVSLMRGRVDPLAVVAYTASWHRNYLVNRLYMRTVLVYGLRVLLLTVAFPVAIVFWFLQRDSMQSQGETFGLRG